MYICDCSPDSSSTTSPSDSAAPQRKVSYRMRNGEFW